MTVSRGASGRGIAAARRPLAIIVIAVVLVQAVMAGRSNRLVGNWDIGVHGTLGNVGFAAAVALLAVVAVRRLGRQSLIAAVALVVVLTAQLGLGYAGRESIDAAAWHIPNGVLAFGLAVWNLTLAIQRPEAG